MTNNTTSFDYYWAVGRFAPDGSLLSTGFVKGRWANAKSVFVGMGVRASTGAIFGIGTGAPSSTEGEVGIFQADGTASFRFQFRNCRNGDDVSPKK